MAKKKDVAWVVLGGKPGELGHCTRCGRGLTGITLPQPIDVIVGAMKGFVEAHRYCEGKYREPTPTRAEEWLVGRDTGTSSKTIYHVMMGYAIKRSPYQFDVPHDPDDFGRCYRLLKLFPAWRERIAEVATALPEWGPLVREWEQLEKLYEEESHKPNGLAPKLYATMQTLIEEGRKVRA